MKTPTSFQCFGLLSICRSSHTSLFLTSIHFPPFPHWSDLFLLRFVSVCSVVIAIQIRIFGKSTLWWHMGIPLVLHTNKPEALLCLQLCLWPCSLNSWLPGLRDCLLSLLYRQEGSCGLVSGNAGWGCLSCCPWPMVGGVRTLAAGVLVEEP